MQNLKRRGHGHTAQAESPDESRTQAVGRKRKLAPTAYTEGTRNKENEVVVHSASDSKSVESGEIDSSSAASDRRSSSASVGNRPVIKTFQDKPGQLWRTFNPDPYKVKKIPREQLIVSCYNCGSNSHWGDDCPTPSKRAAERGPTIWSAKHAALFVQDGGGNQRGNGKR